MVNGALRCTSQAYEVFQYMNQKGWYQVATMEDDTAKRLLHRFVAVGTQHQNTSRIPVYQQAGQPQVENQASPASEYPVQ